MKSPTPDDAAAADAAAASVDGSDAQRRRWSAMTIRFAAAVVAVLVPASVAAHRLPPPQPSPVFDPASFFAGRTVGTATLTVVLAKPTPVHVDGRGRVDGGVLTLDQTVAEGGKAATTRQWTFRPAGPGRYAGTLSDAAGPVAGEVTGNRLHLHFKMTGGIVADQRIDLAADGQSAHNRMTFRKFGIVVARLDEIIRRL